MTTAAFIGVGNIGLPMAKRLLANDDGLVVFDVRPEACDPLVKKGARLADSLADVAASADVISVMVRDDAQVRDVVAGLLEAARPEMVIAVHSTIRAATAVELEADAAQKGVALVDAPFSGGAMDAHEGTLAALVGGTEDAIERCRPVFAHWASLVVHFGPAGAGTKAKLARNLLTFAAYAVVGESQRLAEAAGIDLMKLGDVVRHSDRVTGGPGAIMPRATAGTQEPGDDWYDTFSNVASLGEKDLALALGLADELAVELPLVQLAFDRLAVELGVPHSENHHREGAPMTDAVPSNEARQRGLDKMTEVYGWEVSDGPGDFFGYTVDHLFGEIWNRPGLTNRDRRLLLIGLVIGSGQEDVLDIQLPAALGNEELTDEQLREIVIFVAHYAGWPRAARINNQVETAIARRNKNEGARS